MESGIRNLALVLALVLASISTGFLITAIGYYTPFMYFCTVIMSIGAGLLTTFTPFTSEGRWIGYQILFGFGLGMGMPYRTNKAHTSLTLFTGMQQPNLAAQATLSRRDVSTGASLMVFGQSLGGSIFISVAQNIFSNKLVQGFSAIPGLDPELAISSGATEIRNVVPPELLPQVLDVYNTAIVSAFYVGTALACATVVGAVLMPWTSIKKQKQKKVESSA